MSIELNPSEPAGVPRTATEAGANGQAFGTDSIVLKTVDLTLGFGQRTILTGIGVDVRRGVVTALIGPTGSGKTTLLRTFNRMNDKVTGYRHDGDVLLDGRSIWHSGVELMALRRKVGMLFQRPNPFPMSIAENVTAAARVHRLASKQQLRGVAEEYLTAVGLWNAVKDRLKDSPFRLSGGQQQLLCLARALAIQPDVLLLDEPTSSLDPAATESIEKLLRTLIPGLTVVIVTHNLAQARRIADDTMFLNQGRLVEHGTTEQVFEHPAEEETARYVGGRFG
jgi:phosphate transport system ATP-binding protein